MVAKNKWELQDISDSITSPSSNGQLGQMVMLMFPSRYGATPLHMAAAAGHLSTVKAVLEAGGGNDCQFHDQLIVEVISTVYWIRTSYSCPALVRSW